METGKAIYKCRKCGVKYEDGTVSNYATMEANFYSLVINGTSLKAIIGTKFELTSIHVCDKNNIGVSDLIGLKKIIN